MNATPTINRRLFRTITTLKAQGQTWEAIASKVQIPAAELECLPWKFKSQWLKYSAYAADLVRRAVLANTVATLQTSLMDAEPREQASIANSLARLLTMQQTKPPTDVPIPHTKKRNKREPQTPSTVRIQSEQPKVPVHLPEVKDQDLDEVAIEAELVQAEKHIREAAQRRTELVNVEAVNTPRETNPILQILKQFNSKVAPLSKSAFALLLMCALFMTGTNANEAETAKSQATRQDAASTVNAVIASGSASTVNAASYRDAVTSPDRNAREVSRQHATWQDAASTKVFGSEMAKNRSVSPLLAVRSFVDGGGARRYVVLEKIR